MAPRFLNHLIAKKIGPKRWVLYRDLIFRSALFGDLIYVPDGFVTDFASVPRLPLIYALAGNVAHAPAVIHDFLYQTHKTVKVDAHDPRKLADRIFREAMDADGEVGWFKRRIMYRGVRFGGKSAWNTGPTRYTLQRTALDWHGSAGTAQA